MKKASFYRASFLLTSAGVLLGALGYAYQILMGRMLEAEDFALFGALLSAFAFLSAPLNSISLIIARRVSVLRSHSENTAMLEYFSKSHLFLLFFGCVVLAFISLSLTKLQVFLGTNLGYPVLIVGAAIVSTVLLVICQAFLQAMQRFNVLAVVMVAFGSVKLIVGYVLVAAGYAVSGAVLALAVAPIVVWAFAAPKVRSLLFEDRSRIVVSELSIPTHKMLPTLIATLSFAAMTQLDVLVVKNIFSEQETGIYFASAILGKAVLYLPAGVAAAMFPVVSERAAQGLATSDLLIRSMTVTFMLCLVISIIYWLFSSQILLLFYGPKYPEAGELLKWYGFAITPMALVLVAEHYLIARGRVLFVWIMLVLAPLQIVTIYFLHQGLASVIAMMAGFGSILAILGYGLLYKEHLVQLRRSV